MDERLIALIAFGAIGLFFFTILLRAFLLWMFRLDEIANLLIEIRDLLNKQAPPLP